MRTGIPWSVPPVCAVIRSVIGRSGPEPERAITSRGRLVPRLAASSPTAAVDQETVQPPSIATDMRRNSTGNGPKPTRCATRCAIDSVKPGSSVIVFVTATESMAVAVSTCPSRTIASWPAEQVACLSRHRPTTHSSERVPRPTW